MRRIITVSSLIFFISITAAHAQFSRSAAISFRVNKISETKGGPNVASRSFKRGQKVWFNVNVAGLAKDRQNNYDIEVDYTVSSLDKNKQGKEKVVSKKINAKNLKYYNLHFSIETKPTSKPGKYNIEIEVKDKVSKKYNIYNIAFNVN